MTAQTETSRRSMHGCFSHLGNYLSISLYNSPILLYFSMFWGNIWRFYKLSRQKTLVHWFKRQEAGERIQEQLRKEQDGIGLSRFNRTGRKVFPMFSFIELICGFLAPEHISDNLYLIAIILLVVLQVVMLISAGYLSTNKE